MENLEWELIDFKGKETGVLKSKCPICSHTRKKKNDPCLYVNLDSGVAKCFNCDILSFRDDNSNEAKYTLPNQLWRNYTTLSDKMVKFLQNARKVPQTTCIELGITEEKQYQPNLKKEVTNLVFNYFEGNRLVNKKYRDARKNFTQVKNGKPILYNINSLIGQDTAYIVEGEFDVLALHTYGVKNVVSVPNGANDHDDYWKNSQKYISSIKKFIIGTDNDAKGILLREKIAHRLGKHKCQFIEWKNKDANGDLISGCLDQSLNNLRIFPVAGTYTARDLADGIFDLYLNGLPNTIFPKGAWFGNLKEKFSTMLGHLVVTTGIPTHGKSSFIDWYILNLVLDYDFKANWFSPEHSPMELYKTTMIEKMIGKSFWGENRVSQEEIWRYIEWSDQKIYLTSCEADKLPTWDWLFEKFNQQIYAYGINVFAIDAFNKLILPPGNKIDEINRVLAKLTHFAQSNDVLIFLIAHPTKMSKTAEGIYEIPTLYNCAGSADFRNQTHDGMTIYRYFENQETGHENKIVFHNMKTKFKFQGEIGATEDFYYHKPSGRFLSDGVLNFGSLI